MTSFGNNIIESKSDEHLDNNSDKNVVNNKFANDGSFLELFQKMQKQLSENKDKLIDDNIKDNCVQTNNCPDKHEEKTKSAKTTTSDVSKTTDSLATTTAKTSSTVNKRRTKTLKVGLIKKQRNDEEDEDNDRKDGANDAWNRYMKEVRKYKEKYGDDNDKNRPLVK